MWSSSRTDNFILGNEPGTDIIGGSVAPKPVWAFWRREKLLASAWIRNAGCPTSALVCISTTLSRLIVLMGKLEY
jgi:hypothetical protein